MTEIVEAGELHFSYSGEFIADLARTGYWFENRREWAVRLLKCIRLPRELNEDQIFYMQSRGLTMEQIYAVSEQQTITDEQVGAILNGTAILTEDSKFMRQTDEAFQKALNNHRRNFVEIGNYLIKADVVDKYLKGLEQPRQSWDAYESVLKEAGFVKVVYSPLGRPKTVIEKTPASLGFQAALLKHAQLYLRSREDSK